jgi:hypothetical protein
MLYTSSNKLPSMQKILIHFLFVPSLYHMSPARIWLLPALNQHLNLTKEYTTTHMNYT